MNSSARKLLAWTAYPGVMLVSLILFYALTAWGVNLTISSYVAVVVGGFGLVTFLELALPYRREWLPNWSEVKTDFVFMVVVQVLLPFLLSIAATTWLVDAIAAKGWNVRGLWPQSAPIWLQMLLMMAAADLLRYWLHRASHTLIPLWRLHAVHHSVHRLYWLNVGRFHPLDKSLQFLFDALPFIVLGVSKDVLALYFVAYAINGFFQHSNVAVKLGWLNFIISGPELHRWHHSKTIAESNTNYGNNLIIWDLVFGTYLRPKDREVAELGLLNPEYPMEFLEQLKAPFIKGIDKAK